MVDDPVRDDVDDLTILLHLPFALIIEANITLRLRRSNRSAQDAVGDAGFIFDMGRGLRRDAAAPDPQGTGAALMRRGDHPKISGTYLRPALYAAAPLRRFAPPPFPSGFLPMRVTID